MSDQIIGLHHWFDSPPGRYLLAWEQARFDEAVANIFGYHSLQLGMPLLDGLRANRMPHQWLAMGQEAVEGSIASVETGCLLYTSPSPRDQRGSRMPSSA